MKGFLGKWKSALMNCQKLKTMIQPKLWAQLGNQCFMLSAAIAHAKDMNTTWGAPNRTIDPRIWKTYFVTPIPKRSTLHYYKEPRHSYDPLPEHDDLTIEGYFQSEKYFQDAKPEIAMALGFKYAPLETVSIHVRRGDYLQYPDQFPILPFAYYEESIQQMRALNFDKFRVYSDDIRWCKDAFSEIARYYPISFSDNKDPLTDMREIYNSKAIIIANSTFSLFPALLRYADFIVAAPAEHRWYGPSNSHMETFDLMPERFIKL